MNTIPFLDTTLAGPRLRPADPSKEPDLRAGGDPDSGARHRRQRGDFPARERASHPVASGGEAAGARVAQNRSSRQGAGRQGASGRSLHRASLAGDSLAAAGLLVAVRLGQRRWDLSTEGEAVFARGLYVSGHFFDALGVRAHVGRVLTDADDQKGCGSPGAVLSHAFWQARYGASPGVVGRKIMLDRRPFDVIGVTQPGFFGVEVGRTFDVAIPLCAEPLIRGQ